MNPDRAEAERPGSVERHLQEMLRNRESWENKPVLQRVYGLFYKEIATYLVDPAKGSVVELGSGIGISTKFIPNCVTTDIFRNPWLEPRRKRLPIEIWRFIDSESDLIRRVSPSQYPGAALREFWRVVTPQGRVILFEPAMGLLGKLVYGLFHHEPLALDSRIELFPPGILPEDH